MYWLYVLQRIAVETGDKQWRKWYRDGEKPDFEGQ